jgi:hypothetical protein
MGARIQGGEITGVTSLTATLVTADKAAVDSLVLSRSTVSLTADDQVVPTTGLGYIALSSDSAVAADRTFVLTAGESGQVLILEWVGANAGELVDDSANSDTGNVRLSATWTPTANDTILLIFNGTDWVEICRSTN